MTKNFKKYRYLGMVNPEVPDPWKPTILNMLISIDKIVKPKYYPRFMLNLFADRGGYICEDKVYFSQIKQKFGSLRISASYIPEIQVIIDKATTLCNNTCEFCGNIGTENTTIKGWVRNVCITCKETKKYGTNN